jgi:hypothetical protein
LPGRSAPDYTLVWNGELLLRGGLRSAPGVSS